ncbi:MAG: TetR/AcrR family transcriptional regulator [Pseudomonadota bacterium]
MSDQVQTKAKNDWLMFALNVLKEKGPEHIKIEPLCTLKGVTKGSFYHHFKSRAAFIDALMSFWYEKMTVDFIKQANTASTPLEKLEKLDSVILKNHFGAETHIRAWALKEPIIHDYLVKIDRERQAYLTECYVEMGLSNDTASDLALMAYANFLGMQQIRPTPSIERVLRVTSMSSKLLLEKWV